MVRIDGLTGPARTATSGKSRKKRATAGSRASTPERVQVAEAAALHEKARTLMADMPEVRLGQIEAIREALEQGRYHMDEHKLAVRIVANALAERPW